MHSTSLRESLNQIVKDYPDGISQINGEPLKGTAFFPGGDGFYKEGGFSILPHYPIMVVGQDYDNEFNFKKVKALPNESELDNSNATWINLRKILGEENLRRFFFTNAIMGLRKGDSKNTGPSLAFKKGNELFLEQNQVFFRKQVEDVMPNTIICLGIHLPRFMAACYPETCSNLKQVRSYSDLDNKLPEGKLILHINDKPIKVIFITHPALYYANVSRRKNGKGLAFEKGLLREVLGAGIN